MDKISQVKANVRIKVWADMIRERNNSGLSVREWCVNNGINLKTYYYRQRKVREYICEHNSDIKSDTVAPSVIARHDIVSIPIYADNDSSSIKITASGISVELPTTVLPQLLKAAIEGLKC